MDIVKFLVSVLNVSFAAIVLLYILMADSLPFKLEISSMQGWLATVCFLSTTIATGIYSASQIYLNSHKTEEEEDKQ